MSKTQSVAIHCDRCGYRMSIARSTHIEMLRRGVPLCTACREFEDRRTKINAVPDYAIAAVVYSFKMGSRNPVRRAVVPTTN